MNAKPILFSGPMVRALLDGRKAQTRRVVKPQPSGGVTGCYRRPDGRFIWTSQPRPGNGLGAGVGLGFSFHCPYGQPGDLLYVREAAIPVEGMRANGHGSTGIWPHYEADNLPIPAAISQLTRRRPAHLTPRAWSRLTLRITGVRVERVQEISEEDARAEGCEPEWFGDQPCIPDPFTSQGSFPERSAIYPFVTLWDSLNAGGDFGWDANPWVWVVEFEVIRANVDEVIGRDAA